MYASLCIENVCNCQILENTTVFCFSLNKENLLTEKKDPQKNKGQ